MNRRPFIAGNWKMYLDRAAIGELVAAFKDQALSLPDVEVGVFPPYPYISEVVQAAEGALSVGGQDIYFEKEGAFTGQVSAAMLKDIGATYALIGHSERRHVFGETSADTARKVTAALEEGLKPVLCVGELLSEREAGRTNEVVKEQIEVGLKGRTADELSDLVVAYEPVWAIGTGVTATTEQAGEVHAEIRRMLSDMYSDRFAQKVRILYGGSVKPGNVDELMAVPEIDGVLVGGASLKAESFNRIIGFGESS